MKDSRFSDTHLTWSMNVHPGECWADQARAIEEYARPLKARFSPDKPFGLGLRLSALAAEELCAGPKHIARLREKWEHQGLYVFTVNGFPYGPFHGKAVKAKVYRPDWRKAERVQYTQNIIKVLARLLPPGVSGSISTVPGGFRPDLHEGDEAIIAKNLCLCAKTLCELKHHQQVDICLALEPEPGCLLEKANDVIQFFDAHIPNDPDLRHHLGICLDTCHSALAYEHPAEALDRICAAGIAIPKVQLSAALEAPDTMEGRSALQAFDEPIYLHQVRHTRGDAWNDLPEALATALNGGTLRCHFHVPLFWDGKGLLRSTVSELDDRFRESLNRHRITHLEMETYTFQVLPEAVGATNLLDSLAKEYAWWLNSPQTSFST